MFQRLYIIITLLLLAAQPFTVNPRPLTLFSPRIGVSDHNHNHNHDVIDSNLIKDVIGWAPRWPYWKRNLTYSFNLSVEVLPQEVVKDAFKVAFEQWSRVSKFTFEEVPINDGRNGIHSDLVIGFFRGDHGDAAPFEQYGRMLAHAFGPPDGRLHLNADEPWSTRVPIEKGFFDLVWVAMHEIGHNLGLKHSNDPGAVMYAYVEPGVNKRNLSDDDINLINDFYSLSVERRIHYFHLLTIFVFIIFCLSFCLFCCLSFYLFCW